MSSEKRKGYASKQAPGYKADPALLETIKSNLKDNMLPCAVAFKIAEDAQVLPIEVGRAADSQEIPLAKCQLGLFGYQPDKKIVKADMAVPEGLLEAIRVAMENERLPCVSAWKLAEDFQVTKLKVSNVCEGQGIKIKPCQLGAF